MNRFLSGEYAEHVHSLALGLEPIDAAREQPMLWPVRVAHDDDPLGVLRPPWGCHASNRQALLYDAYYAAAPRTLTLRLYDQAAGPYGPRADRRRFVPRRLRIELPTLAAADAAPRASRGCRPFLFPAAAYPVSETVTGLRAHVMRAAQAQRPLRPARWARVEALVPAVAQNPPADMVVGRACCDDRGEFLLLLRHHPGALGKGLVLEVRLRVFAAAEMEPPNAAVAKQDLLWDAPVERPASLADDDAVLRGEALPAGYAAVAERRVALPLGRLLRGQPPLLI